MNEPSWKETYWYDLRKDYGLLEGGPYYDVKIVAERAVALANERDPETGKANKYGSIHHPRRAGRGIWDPSKCLWLTTLNR